MQTTNQAFDADIIIVGAGPIGLTTGCALRHHKVDCLLLEQRIEPKPYSRANNIWARPQELLHSIGMRHALSEKAYVVDKINAFVFEKPDKAMPVEEESSPFGQVLYSGQDVIETTLSDTYLNRSGRQMRGVKVLSLVQDGTGVSVSITDDPNSDEATRTLRCRYVVGADGNEGIVRKSIGADYSTESFEGRMNRQMDAKLSWRRSTDPDQLWFFYYKTGFCGVMPVWGGYHRLFFLESDEGVPDRDPTLEEIQQLGRDVTGDDSLTLTDPIWATHSRFKHGVSPQYADGRVFLVGDAGHFTLPIGGQGMNAGFHDAVEIAWRLAMELNGVAAPAVLDTYSIERQGEHERLDKQQAQGFRQIMYRGALGDAALKSAAQIIPYMGTFIQGTSDPQQLSVGYPKSALSGDHMGLLDRVLHRGEPRAGDRAPDAPIRQHDGTTGTVFDHVYNPDGQSWGWALLVFDGGKDGVTDQAAETLRGVAAWSFIRPKIIAGSGKESTTLDTERLYDFDNHAHRAFGLGGRPAFVLIRPDGHIAVRTPLDRGDALLDYCRATFRTDAEARYR